MGDDSLSRRTIGLGLGLGLASLWAASGATAREAETVETDRLGRMTLRVRLDGQGPYRFALDSAASLSMIASDLVDALRLTRDADIQLHTLLARERAPTVRAQRMQCGALDLARPRLAVGSRVAMAGLDGLISAAALDDQRVTMRFRGDRMTIGRSRGRSPSLFSDEHRIPFRSPPGAGLENLVMVDVRVSGRPATAIIDTGAQSSIANLALVEAAHALPATLPDGTRTRPVQSATGRTAEALMMVVRDLHFGPVSLERLPVLAGDFHTFAFWGLADRPAILLGVDVLGAFESVAIDFNTRQLVFQV